MNEHFVCIKVDREERPDVDPIYMTRRPGDDGRRRLADDVFLTPDGSRSGRHLLPARAAPRDAGLPQVLAAVGTAWDEQREEIRSRPADRRAPGGAAALPPEDELARPRSTPRSLRCRKLFDPEHGGFGGRRRSSPTSMTRVPARSRTSGEMSRPHAAAMASGGIYDQIGGGFARYSVDARWLVPHFEKMLYDNALLARAYLQAWQVTGDAVVRAACARDARLGAGRAAPGGGGFASALDADTEGVEGKFYVWTLDEVRAVLGAERARGVAPSG